jgi:glycolate oxidase iron-sulfur subunit
MKEVLEGGLELSEALPHIDPCLGCLACVTACPSGVAYDELITPFKMMAEETRQRSWWDRLLRRVLLETLPYPHRLRLAALSGRLVKPFVGLFRGRLGAMLALLPDRLPAAPVLPERQRARGTKRARVALLAGCAQQVLEPEINWATIRVLSENGVEVIIPPEQGCCGALAAHTGVAWQAIAFAKQTIAAFPEDVEAIITNAAGCGSGLHEYPLWLKGQPEEAQAHSLAAKAIDVSAYLSQQGLSRIPKLSQPLTVAYHDACHLMHAQGVSLEPRALLRQIEGLQLVPLADSEICCGSAGTYNIEQPEIARQLGLAKAKAVVASGASIVLSGNIGCMTQLKSQLKAIGAEVEVLHTMQLLDRLYQQEA